MSSNLDTLESRNTVVLRRRSSVSAGWRCIEDAAAYAPTAANSDTADPVFGIPASERRQHQRYSGGVVWLTGPSGAGQSALASALEQILLDRGAPCVVLNGDALQATLKADLASAPDNDPDDDEESMRYIGEMAGLAARAGLLAIVACIAPRRSTRDSVRRRIGAELFVEVFVDTGPDASEAPSYERPFASDFVIDMKKLSPAETSRRLFDFVTGRFGAPANTPYRCRDY